MAALPPATDSRLAPAPPRRAQVQAALILAGLVPGAAMLAQALAEDGGARAPALSGLLTLAICLVGGAGVLWGLERARYPHARLGLCNAVTLLRAAGIAVLAGLVIAPQALAGPQGLGWALVGLAGAVLALDFVDGWAARRSGLRSDFGARFDVETDVVFAIVLAALAWQAGKVGVWFLALGALRPAYLAAGALVPALRAPLPPAMWRKSVAAVQMTAQVALLAPVIAPPWSQGLAAAVLGGVMLSFAVDIRWLLRADRPADRPRA
jgi:phosphatidylglycerophosphate synthase